MTKTPQRRPPSQLPLDDLQDLLQPLQALSEEEAEQLDLGAQAPEAMATEELLAFQEDGTPSWWPRHRDENGSDWTDRERPRVLLARIREHLPADFPTTPSARSDVQRLLRTLRHIAYGVTSKASGILSSS